MTEKPNPAHADDPQTALPDSLARLDSRELRQMAERVLAEAFGIEGFREHQWPAIESILRGRDLLLTLPTGAGKSLVYQLPAVMLDGLTLVISPLIALMKDQVDALRRKGLRATFVNSSLSEQERRQRLEGCSRGKFDLLFVTPERFRSAHFRELLPSLGITRMAVDEAHCISQWGHDFRPDYWRLGEYRELLGDPPTAALTATATPQVADDIVAALRLRDPHIERAGIERPNLFLACTRVDTPDDVQPALRERLEHLAGAGIVYSTLIRDLEGLHTDLRRAKVPSLVYHGKLSSRERRSMQERFMASQNEVVLATNAFGMGVDKANIRFVLHAQMPRTLEAWTQEVGRAGRDGAPAWCELIYTEEDLAIQQNFIGWANPTREYLVGVYETLRGWGERTATKDLDDLRAELLVKNRSDNRVSISLRWLEVLGVLRGSFESHDLEVVGELNPSDLPEAVGSEEKMRANLGALLGMWQYAEDRSQCRRIGLAEHFGLPAAPENCGACDHCCDVETWCREHFEPRPANVPNRPTTAAAGPDPIRSATEGDNGAPGLDADAEAKTREQAAPTGGSDPHPRSPRAEPGTEGPRASAQPRETAPQWARGDWIRVEGRHLGQIVRVEGEGSRVRLVVESVGDLRQRTVDPRRKRVERLES